MEAMYNEMVRLGIDEYNTNFLVYPPFNPSLPSWLPLLELTFTIHQVAGIDTIEALLKLTDQVCTHTPAAPQTSEPLFQELSDMGIESVEQRTHVLAQLQLVKGEGALSQASAGTSEQASAEDMFASIEHADLDSAVSFEEAAAHTGAAYIYSARSGGLCGVLPTRTGRSLDESNH